MSSPVKSPHTKKAKADHGIDDEDMSVDKWEPKTPEGARRKENESLEGEVTLAAIAGLLDKIQGRGKQRHGGGQV